MSEHTDQVGQDLDVDFEAILAGTTTEDGVDVVLADNNEDDGSADIDALLAGLEGTETIVAAEDDAGEEIVLSDKELGIDKQAIYEAQNSTVQVGSDEDAAPVASTKRRNRSSTPKNTAPAGDSDAPLTKSALLKKKADVSGLKTLGYDDDEIEGIMASIDAAPKKVAEKANNLLRYGLGREHISNFSRFTLNKLRAADDMKLSVPDLVKAMMSERNYSVGTARSQSQQMSRLFTIFGMADKTGSVMTLDPNHRLTKALLGRLDGEPGWARATDSEPAGTDEAESEAQVESLAQDDTPAPETHTEKAAKRRKGKGKADQQKLAA